MFKGKKTYVVSLIALLSAFAGYYTGDLSIPQAAQMGLSAVLAATLRNGLC